MAAQGEQFVVRASLDNAAFVEHDEPVELAIQEQLLGLMDGKTVIAIAHRLSTIARLDRLIVLDEGRIVEAGSHDELLALGGHYSALWQHQSGGFLPNHAARPASAKPLRAAESA